MTEKGKNIALVIKDLAFPLLVSVIGFFLYQYYIQNEKRGEAQERVIQQMNQINTNVEVVRNNIEHINKSIADHDLRIRALEYKKPKR